MEERQERVFKAKMCEQAERYEDMIKEMAELSKLSTKNDALTVEERNLLSVAYKNVVGAKRSSWRVISNKLDKETVDVHKRICQETRGRIEQELNELCGEVLGLLNKYLIPSASEDEAKIFFLKMKGDYHRYMVEICDESQSGARDELTAKAQEAYTKAIEIAKENLSTTNPIRLGLALNYSVFLYEIKGSPTDACALAEAAFQEALPELEKMDEGVYKDSTLIMQLLRDNLVLWKSETENDDENAD